MLVSAIRRCDIRVVWCMATSAARIDELGLMVSTTHNVRYSGQSRGPIDERPRVTVTEAFRTEWAMGTIRAR